MEIWLFFFLLLLAFIINGIPRQLEGLGHQNDEINGHLKDISDFLSDIETHIREMKPDEIPDYNGWSD